MGTKDEKPLSAGQLQSVWDEEAAKLVAPVAEEQPTQEAVAVKDEPVAVAEEVPAAEDPLAGVPDAVREKLAGLEKLGERMRNIEGHIGGLTNGQKELKTLLTASQEAASKVKEAPTQAEVKAAVATPEKWNALKAEYSEWAEAVEAFVDSRIVGAAPASVDGTAVEKLVDARLAKLTPTIRQEVAEDFLEGEFGNWKDEVKTPKFTDWFNTQAEEVKSLAKSSRVSDAAKLLRLYRAPAVAAAVVEDDPGAKITADRQKKLAAAADALPKGAHKTAAKSVEDMTIEELWAYEDEQRRKKKSA